MWGVMRGKFRVIPLSLIRTWCTAWCSRSLSPPFCFKIFQLFLLVFGERVSNVLGGTNKVTHPIVWIFDFAIVTTLTSVLLGVLLQLNYGEVLLWIWERWNTNFCFCYVRCVTKLLVFGSFCNYQVCWEGWSNEHTLQTVQTRSPAMTILEIIVTDGKYDYLLLYQLVSVSISSKRILPKRWYDWPSWAVSC